MQRLVSVCYLRLLFVVPLLGNTIGDGIADAERKIDLMNECMAARGYTEVK